MPPVVRRVRIRLAVTRDDRGRRPRNERLNGSSAASPDPHHRSDVRPGPRDDGKVHLPGAHRVRLRPIAGGSTCELRRTHGVPHSFEMVDVSDSEAVHRWASRVLGCTAPPTC